MFYILAIALEKHQIQVRLFDQNGKASAITERFIEPEFQALTDENATSHVQRIVMDGILSLLQKSEVGANQVLAAGIVTNSSAERVILNLNLEWPIFTTSFQNAFIYGHSSFESDSALAVFKESIQVICPQGMTSEGLKPFQVAVIPTGGSVIKWLEQSMNFIETEADLERLAFEATSNLGVYFVPALDGLGMPFENAAAKGMFIGLTRGSQRAHLVRAVQESFAYHVKATLAALPQASNAITEISVSGDPWLNSFVCQTLADVCQMPVKCYQETCLPLRGAAYQAGLAANLWKTASEVACLMPKAASYQPNKDLSTGYAKWTEAVERAKSDIVTVKK